MEPRADPAQRVVLHLKLFLVRAAMLKIVGGITASGCFVQQVHAPHVTPIANTCKVASDLQCEVSEDHESQIISVELASLGLAGGMQ